MKNIICFIAVLVCLSGCVKNEIPPDPRMYDIKGTWKVTKHASEIHDASGKVLDSVSLTFPIEFVITATRLVTNGPQNTDTTKLQVIEKGLFKTLNLENWIPFTRPKMQVFYVKAKKMKLVAESTDTDDITYKNGNQNALGHKFYMMIEMERQ